MARIRTIKPDFFVSEDVSALPLRARLTWIGLWTQCDDHGRTKDVDRLIKAAVWPLDDLSLREVEEDLAVLAEHGRIVRYVVDGKGYLAVVNWHVHQAISKASKARHPAPPYPVNPVEPGANGYCADCAKESPGDVPDDSRNVPGGLPLGKEGRERRGRAREPPAEPSRNDDQHPIKNPPDAAQGTSTPPTRLPAPPAATPAGHTRPGSEHAAPSRPRRRRPALPDPPRPAHRVEGLPPLPRRGRTRRRARRPNRAAARRRPPPRCREPRWPRLIICVGQRGAPTKPATRRPARPASTNCPERTDATPLPSTAMTTVLDLHGSHVGTHIGLQSPSGTTRDTIRGTLQAISIRTIEGQDQPVVKLRIETLGGIARITVPADTIVNGIW